MMCDQQIIWRGWQVFLKYYNKNLFGMISFLGISGRLVMSLRLWHKSGDSNNHMGIKTLYNLSVRISGFITTNTQNFTHY
jgi:hypothetical protein